MKSLVFYAAIALLLTAAARQTQAHPVTYEGGWGVMSWNTPMMSDQWLAYSVTRNFALTARYLAFRGDAAPDREWLLPQANFLLKRWNELDSQANVYLMAGYGAQRESGVTTGAGLGAIEADWESRKFYLSGKVQSLWATGSQPLLYARARVGVAPYAADFEKLQTWFMIQAESQPQYLRVLEVTPLLRFFYQNVLWELGASLRGNWMLNFMVHL